MISLIDTYHDTPITERHESYNRADGSAWDGSEEVMATVALQDLIGQTAYSWDEVKIGKVRRLVREGEFRGHLVIGRHLLSRGLLVPPDAVQVLGDRLVVRRYRLFLDPAPPARHRARPALHRRALREFGRGRARGC